MECQHETENELDGLKRSEGQQPLILGGHYSSFLAQISELPYGQVVAPSLVSRYPLMMMDRSIKTYQINLCSIKLHLLSHSLIAPADIWVFNAILMPGALIPQVSFRYIPSFL